jgi:hypothetical protein
LPVAVTSPVRRYVLIAASLLALGIVLITMLMPERVSRLFRLRTEGVAGDALEVPVPPLPTGSANAAPSLSATPTP